MKQYTENIPPHSDRMFEMEQLLDTIRERSKELNCLYKVEKLLKDYDITLEEIFNGIIKSFPSACRFCSSCNVMIRYQNEVYKCEDLVETEWAIEGIITYKDEPVGSIKAFYTQDFGEEEPFSKEEVKLLRFIAERLSNHIYHRRTQEKDKTRRMMEIDQSSLPKQVVLKDLYKSNDPKLFIRIARKMLNHLYWRGIKDADLLMQSVGKERSSDVDEFLSGGNRPRAKFKDSDVLLLCYEIFKTADDNLPDIEIIELMKKWMQEDRASFLIKTLERSNSSLDEIVAAIRRYKIISEEGGSLSEPLLKGVRVALIRRIITEQLEYIKIAKDYIDFDDFADLVEKLIFPRGSHGQLGGKGAGLFLAYHILKKQLKHNDKLADVKIPKTWYITSDGLHYFLDYNNLEEVAEQKYKA